MKRFNSYTLLVHLFAALLIASASLAIEWSGGGGGSWNGGTVTNDIEIEKTAPRFTLDATETPPTEQEDQIFFFSRNKRNGGDTYAVQSGWSYGCYWNPAGLSGAGAWVKSWTSSRRCTQYGVAFSGDFTIKYGGASWTVNSEHTDTEFTRGMELWDNSSLSSVWDVQFTNPWFQADGLSTAFKNGSGFVYFKGNETANLIQWVDLGTRPGCTASTRGGVWYDAGIGGVQDTFAVCAKDAADAYAWRVIY